MNKAGGNWVAGDDFFDREAELEALAERVKEGTHTLLTAQRRIGEGAYRFMSGLLQDWWRTRHSVSRVSTSTAANPAPSTKP